MTYQRSPARVSVIIPFRDKAHLTVSAIRSLLAQQPSPELEVVLVDNQSAPDQLAILARFMESHANRRVTFRLVRYDRAFNHSAQCNLGVRSSRGDVVLLMNNDARFVSGGALEAMASWSLQPAVGTVGVRVHAESGELESAGLVVRSSAPHEWDSPVEGSRDAAYAYQVRQTWGNGFACVALSRATYERVGPLDEVRFPNGYNDVEYSARCRRAGLVNMYLGTHHVVHTPGTSRGRVDETYQKVGLRREYPELMTESFFQLRVRPELLVPSPDQTSM